MSQKLKLDRSNYLYEEAQTLIPGGVAGIRRPYNFVPGEYPIFFKDAKGGKVTDVDGNEYIDMLCAYGPIIIGHREEEIDNAVIDQIRTKGFCFSLCQEIQNTLAKKLIEVIPCAEKVAFVKTGSDATTTATRIARAHTDKLKIFRCGYHGWHDWCVENKGGIPSKLFEDVHEFEYNKLNELEELFKKYSGQVAAVIITPIGHPLAHEVQMPKPGYLQAVKELTQKNGAVLIFDEIRSGFRVSLGGAQQEFGITPDLAVFGKAVANGYPMSFVAGKAEIMDALVSKAFLSSTFFPNSLEHIAALKTIEIMQRDKILEKIKEKGQRFATKIETIVKNSGVACQFSGGPWMPYITFDKDDKNIYKKIRPAFYTELIRRGVFLQPYHHGYVCYRHTDKDLEYAACAIEESFKEIKKMV